MGRRLRAGWGIAVLAAVAACGKGEGPAASLVIENVTLIDGTDGGARPGMTVAVSGDRIVAVGPTGSTPLGEVASRIDGNGLYLIPGLWDSHAHLFGYQERALPLFLANGVTTIRDVGGVLDRVGYLRQETRFNRLLGPTILMAGPVLDAPLVTRQVGSGRISVPTPAEAGQAVDTLAKAGVDFIKVHSLTPRAAYFEILRAARSRGLPVVGHVPDSVSAAEAIDSGQRTIEHDFGIALANSSRGPELVAWLEAASARYVARAGDRARIGPLFDLRLAARDSALASYDSATAAGFAARAAAKDVWFTPTLTVLMSMARRNERAVREPPELRFAPKEVLEYDEGLPPSANPTAAEIAAGRAAWEQTKAEYRELVRAKARFLAGTDTPVVPLVPGFSLHWELELLVEIGLTPLEAIQAATRNPAQAMGREHEGTIAVGNVADLVLLAGDPLADIANVRKVISVVTRGRILERTTLDRFLQDAETFAKQR
ncbi:MAG: amidohydrolase family protein [Gemmatimonadales bacterium]